ncbi:MAG: STN domain-containing protein [Blastocatellales bacterium]
MINRSFVQRSRKILASALFLLLCCSGAALAQTPSDVQELGNVAQIISFKDTSLKAAINSVGKQLNLNVVFDEAIKDSEKLTLELREVSFEQALKIFLVAKRLQARIIEENTIIVFPDNATNRERYGQYELWPAKSGGN